VFLKKINLELLALGIILAIGALLRLVKLGVIPPGPYLDEVLYGLDARSILLTGRDIYGHIFPLAFQSVGYVPPVYNYFLAPFVGLFGLSAWVIRLPTAISGILSILFTYLVAKEVTGDKKNLIPHVTSLIVALSVWNIHFSRVAFIASFGMIFVLVGIYLFLKSRKFPLYLILSAVFFGVATQVHHDGYKLISPFIFGVLVLFNWSFVKKLGRKIIIAVLVVWFVAIFVNWIAYHYYNAGFRAHALLGSGPAGVIQEYLKTYSPNFLFINGDPDRMRNPAGGGELPLALLPFLLLGLFNFRLLNKQGRAAIIGWLLIAPVPSAIAGFGDHALRNSLLIIPLAAISALGLERLIAKCKKSSTWIIILVLSLAIYSYQTVSQLGYYFGRYSRDYNILWGESLRQSVDFALKNAGGYDRVIFTDSYSSSLSFWAFKTEVSPSKLQNAILFPEISNGVPVKRIDKFYFVPSEEEKNRDWYLEMPKSSLIIDPYFYLEGDQFKTIMEGNNKLFKYTAI